MLERPWFQPGAALAAYAEPLVVGHAVLVFGDASSGLGERLLERGARLVHVYDREAARAAEAAARNTSNRLTIAPYGDGGLALREGAFDFALVEDLGHAGDAAGLLRHLHRALSARGVALVATPNPDVRVRLLPANGAASAPVSFDYYALYDAVSEHFAYVRMLGQTPFVGYAVVDFAPEAEPSPVIDTDFVPGGAEEAEWYIALAAKKPQILGEFTVVQLPFKSALATGTTRRLEDQLRAAQAAERRARSRMADLEVECAKLLRGERGRPAEASHDAVYKALEQRDNWIAQLEARAVTADTRADEAQSELDTARERITELEAELESLRAERTELSERLTVNATETAQLREQTAELTRLLDDQRARTLSAEQAVIVHERRLGELLESTEQESAREISALEAQLAQVGAHVQQLQSELKEAERVGRELVQALPQPSDLNGAGTDQPADLTAKLDALAGLNAQREADLAAARWVIEKLEARLEEGGQPCPNTALELELAQARAVLQRQEVLLAQARRSVWRADDPGDRSGLASRSDERSLTE